MTERCDAAEAATALALQQQKAAELQHLLPASPHKDSALLAEVQTLRQQM